MRLQLTCAVPQSSGCGTPENFAKQLHTYELDERARRYQSAVTELLTVD